MSLLRQWLIGVQKHTFQPFLVGLRIGRTFRSRRISHNKCSYARPNKETKLARSPTFQDIGPDI
jgi:hypothetical protein